MTIDIPIAIKSNPSGLNQMDIVLVILNELDRQQPGIELIPRQFNAVIKGVDQILHEIGRDEIDSVPGSGIHAWRQTDQVGRSSDYMAAVLGPAGIREYAYPHDPSDFGLCLKLLEAAPELKERVPQMAETGPMWKMYVQHWDEMVALWEEESPTGKAPKLYALMQKIQKKAAQVDKAGR